MSDMDMQQAQGHKDEPETDPLAKQWQERISRARKHWEPFHKRVQHNRKTVAGFDWSKKPDDQGFYKLRANLLHGAISATLPQIYARNPEISAAPLRKEANIKLFCDTLETVTNRMLEQAKLKQRAKMTVRSALTCSIGVVKVMYQRDIQRDPIIVSRIQDTQDNIQHIEGLLASLEDQAKRADQEAMLEELRITMQALEARAEVVAAEGLVIDRVLTDNLLVDPDVAEFWDYPDADWIAQVVPMKRSRAEAIYGMKLDRAKTFKGLASMDSDGKRLASGGETRGSDDEQIAIVEVWDKASHNVLTLAEGCDFWLREPYVPERVGERWYPFFLLPYQVVDGQFVGPSMVDLMEKLQDEHNQAREAYNEHRELCKPGWVTSGDIAEKTLKRFTDSALGEVTIIDTEGRPVNQVFIPRQHPPFDPAVYDTGPVRYDIEQVTGLQDAMRSTVVQPKTATEASIMQQGLSGRVSEFRDQVEDWLQEIAQYAAEILLQELTEPQVQRIMGQPDVDPMTGQVLSKPYDWPQLAREDVFDMVQMRIRAGTAGQPDKVEQQENWTKVLPVVQGLLGQIIQLQAAGQDAEPFIVLLRETVARFDERMDVEMLIPKPPPPPMPMPQQQPGMPMPAPDMQAMPPEAAGVMPPVI